MVKENEMKPGDRVEVIKKYVNVTVGMKGVIKDYIPNLCSVEMDNSFDGGHTCDGRCKDGHGYCIPESYLKLIQQEIPRLINVYVSNVSEKDARTQKEVRRYITNVGGKSPHCCANRFSTAEDIENNNYHAVFWKYAVPVEENPILKEYQQLEKEMQSLKDRMSELNEKLKGGEVCKGLIKH
jgi:hypothetical protein